MNRLNFKRTVLWVLLIIGAIFGGVVFRDRSLSWLILSAVVILCGYAFAKFEKKELSAGEISVTAAMTALSVMGRLAFAAVPAFKPCSAVIILTGMYLGAGQGFMAGALTALVSNFYFSQGIWTPFQMLAWGLTGFAAGLLSKPLRKSTVLLCIFGGLAGGFFSVFMDFWSVIWADNAFNLSRFLAMTAGSVWFTLTYAASNIIFLLLLKSPADRIFTRLRRKYGIGTSPMKGAE
ncbi:MAG: ECF transporter S component [Ruminococcus sp.]|nr:ECF transporter S component [Ruminococcus sp.]